MTRTFVLGDVHGAYRALRQCLERSGFEREKDRLIFLGDVCDGWPETKECVAELLSMPNLIYLLGNHDVWFLDWMERGYSDDIWLMQGGQATVESYRDGIPDTHISLLSRALKYFEEGNKLFVHAGIPPDTRPEHCTPHELLWDRTLTTLAIQFANKADTVKLTPFDEVFVGHTPIQSPRPMKYCEVWMMDTGAGWSGVLSMMNLDTKECFMSDPVPELYPGVRGRQKT